MAKKVTKSETKKAETKTTSGLNVSIYLLNGEVEGNLKLPETLFGRKVVKSLLSQAIRVYLNNKTGHFSNTKTRAQVQGSSKKIYRQKGTGRARHGSLRAPIFVGGGIALGPKSRKIDLNLPDTMKKVALIMALSLKHQEKLVVGVEGLDKIAGKTSTISKLVNKLDSQSILLITDKVNPNLERATRNMKSIDLILAEQLNVYEVIKHQMVVLTKEAISKLETRLGKKEAREIKGGQAAAVAV